MSNRAESVKPSHFDCPLVRDEMLPEFKAVRADSASFAKLPHVRQLLETCEANCEPVEQLPRLTYSLYQLYERTGNRRKYDNAQRKKRTSAASAALLAIFRDEQRWIDILQDLVWSICEETCWVPPEHIKHNPIDLFSSETAFMLAEIEHLLGDQLDEAVRRRIRAELKVRILDPYLANEYGWSDGHNNWTGVCESSVGSTFLYLEQDPDRMARAINRVLEGLSKFVERAFLADGGSSEGIGYWQYGLINTVNFSALLRERTGGEVNFLAHDKFKKIALYPLAVQTGPESFYSVSDSAGGASFAPGMIARLAERTDVDGILALINKHTANVGPDRFPHAIRSVLWWDGKLHQPPRIDDYLLPDTGVARIVDERHNVVLIAKAGHNNENHNQNDVGSFALYVGGEPMICDPGPGLYDKEYFGPNRYENPLCGSYGHSVPRIAGRVQPPGEEYGGRIAAFDIKPATKTIGIEFAGAYGIADLTELSRTITLATGSGDTVEIVLEDRYVFTGQPLPVEEAFTTWAPVSVGHDGTAVIHGTDCQLELRIVEPDNAQFEVEDLSVAEKGSGGSTATLRRLACRLTTGGESFKLKLLVTN